MLSYRPWKLDSAFRLLLALVGGFGLLGLAAYAADNFITGVPKERLRLLISVLGTLVYQGVSVILIQKFLQENELTWGGAFGFRKAGLGRNLGVAAVMALLVFPANLTLMKVCQQILEWKAIKAVPQEAVEALRTSQSATDVALLAVLALLTAPVLEELLYRGILYPSIKQAGFPRIAFWGTALLFAAAHVNTVTFVPLVFFALMQTLLYEYTDNLMAPMLSHSLFNSANFLWVMLDRAS